MENTTIEGVEFTAVRKTLPRPHWVAKVAETGEELPQGYATRPEMWEDLRRVALASGPALFALPFLTRGSEAEQAKRGELLAEMLGLKVDKSTGRYFTTGGDKTALGLFRTCKRIIEGS